MIINSLLDVDLYKYTMLQVYHRFYPNANARFRLFFRDGHKFTRGQFMAIREEILSLGTLFLSIEDMSYLSGLSYLKSDFLTFLRSYQLDPAREVMMSISKEGDLNIEIDANVLKSTMYETFIMSIISEVCFSESPLSDLDDINDKIEISNNGKFVFIEFGTRRRSSRRNQEWVNKVCLERALYYHGSSNVKISMDQGTAPIGTMAHEWIMAQQAVTNIHQSELLAMELWSGFYGDKLSIALTDTLTTRHFLDRAFDKELATRFDGVRQDSGNPVEWMNAMIEHYKKLGIDPTSKKYVFSDGLNFHRAARIAKEFPDYEIIFGIGTNLSNDVGVVPLNMVVKMVEFNGYPLIKMSDSPGKIVCEDDNLAKFCCHQINYKVWED